MFFIALVLLVVALVLLPLAIVSNQKRKKTDGKYSNMRLVDIFRFIIAGICVAFGLILGITAISMQVDTAGKITQLEAFQTQNLSAFVYSVDATGTITLQGEKISVPGSVTDFGYLKLAQMSADRIRELRDNVVWYNETLAWYKRANGMFLLGSMYADVPADLKPIKLGA